ncbi:MAG: lamin tail domain-containing protein [Patescibacteria group bacterium]
MNKIQIFFVRFLVVLLALQGTVAAQLLTIKSAQAADPVPAVVINELMWMGTFEDSNDEWIELRNTTDTAIDISGWQLTNAQFGGDGVLDIPAGKTIGANGLFLISRKDAANSKLAIEPDFLANSTNSPGNILQIDNNCPGGSTTFMQLLNPLIGDPPTVIDQAGCDSSGNPLKGSSTPAVKKAMERNILITDGLLVTSWHNSASQINLDLGAVDFASPKAANGTTDTTPPTIGTVTDDGQFTANPNQLNASWTGFADPESGVASYKAGVGTAAGLNDVVALKGMNLVTSYTFTVADSALGFPLQENAIYFVNVVATNGVGLTSLMASSSGITVNTVNPLTPANLKVADVPSDNGGSLKATWDASSVDTTSYQLNYRKAGDLTWSLPINVGLALEKTISGLLNAPVSYEFTVEAIDFNAQHSTPSAIVLATALDNLVPIIDANKVVVNQNKPGTADTVAGLAGAANEPEVAVVLLSAAPEDPTATVIGSVLSNPDGSWPAIGIEDNKYSRVWLVLVDEGDNVSLPLQLNNDIVGPIAPVLNKVVANCESSNCRVTLDWQAGSTDTASYKVTYTVDGVDHQTFEVTTTSMAMDLATGKSYLFKVVGYDQYGNPSTASNIFSVTLNKGVKTTAVLTNGKQVTTTEAISGSLEVKTTPVSAPKPAPAQFAPKVKAAEPVVETPTEPTPPLVADTENSRDWVRILVVVVLLLIIAGSFYALSRSVQETPEEEFDRNKAESKAEDTAGTTKRRGRRRHRR